MRGAIVWAYTGFQPEAPFQVVTGAGEAASYSTAVAVTQAIRDGTLGRVPRFLVEAKLRPVVLLQDRPLGVLPEYATLKLARFSKLSRAEKERVRNGEEPALFHLQRAKAKYGLDQENAVDLNSLVRLHRSVIVTRPVGYLDENEIDVLGRRLARFLDIDLTPAIQEGVLQRWEQLIAEQERRRGEN
jgi:hypothetical protein